MTKTKIKKRFARQTATLLMAAFGLISALAWNDAVQTLFKNVFGEISQIWAKFVYAVVITLIAVIVVMIANRFKQEEP